MESNIERLGKDEVNELFPDKSYSGTFCINFYCKSQDSSQKFKELTEIINK